MNYEKLIDLFGDRPFFESGEVRIAFEEPRAQIEARLSRWVNNGKLLKLRQKKYLLPGKYRRNEPSPEYISNYLYRPSYISLRTALSIYGIIPESVHTYEAVTTKKTAKWDTLIGTFKYYSIKGKRFWGYTIYPNVGRTNNQKSFMLGEPEKVLLDLFFLIRGEWTEKRIKEMRLQNLSIIKKEKLEKYAEKFDSPKVKRGVKRFIKIYSKETT